MGYFILAEFSLIESLGAYWLSRIPANVHIKTLEGKAIEEVLRKRKTELIDMAVTLGEEAKPARLVAIRATVEVAEKNLREASEKARLRGHTLSVGQKERCRWHLIATNVPAEKMDTQAASDLYTCRWNIEIIFRAWKQGMNLARALDRRRSLIQSQPSLSRRIHFSYGDLKR
jgi:ribosomal protein L12E/L44/L45/RPP1/RPP2